MKRICGLGLAVLFFAVQVALPQTTTTTPTSDPQAIALATQALTALTGSVQVSDVTLTGAATRIAGSDIETGTITLEALGTGNSSLSLVTSAGTRSETRSTANGFPQGCWVGIDGTAHAMANHNCVTDAVWFFPALTVLSQAASTNVLAKYVGLETRNGGSVQHIRLQTQIPSPLLATLSTEDIYLDSTSSLPVAIIFTTHPDANALANIPVEIDFSNYQTVSGVSVPFSIQKLLNGSLFLDITIQSATFNSGLSPSAFAAPCVQAQ